MTATGDYVPRHGRPNELAVRIYRDGMSVRADDTSEMRPIVDLVECESIRDSEGRDSRSATFDGEWWEVKRDLRGDLGTAVWVACILFGCGILTWIILNAIAEWSWSW